MKRYIAAAAAGLLAATATAYGRIDRFMGERYELPATGHVAGQMWVVAGTAAVQGVVGDDFLAAAHEVSLGGQVNGDLWMVCGSASVTGAVEGDVHALSLERMRIAGRIGGNLVAASGASVEISPVTTIGGDVAAVAGESLVANGRISGRAYLVARKLTVGGRIEGTLRLTADDVVLLPGTYIGGDIVYTLSSGRELVVPDGVVVAGKVRSASHPPPPPEETRRRGTWAGRFLSQFFFLGAALLTGVLWIILFPAASEGAAAAWQGSLLKSLLVGLGVLVISPVFVLSALFSLIGTPLGVAGASLYALLLVLSKPAAGFAIGSLILRRVPPSGAGQRVSCLFLGLAAIYLVALIPGLGVAIWTFATATGMGALVLYWFRSRSSFVLTSQPPPVQNGG